MVGLLSLSVSVVLAACGGETSVSGTTTTAEADDRAEPAELASVIESLWVGRPDDEPGCAAGVSDETGSSTTAHGVADLDSGLSIDESTLFDLGSVSKQFTGGVILGLVEEGHLTLDDTVRSWLPEVVGPAGDVALRDLLHHRSGIPDYTLPLLQSGVGFDVAATQADAIGLFADAPLGFEPGSRFEYSNTNYVLLAEVAQRASQQAFTELVEVGFFEPAEMKTAFVSDYHSTSPVVATSYSAGPEFGVHRWRWTQVGDGAIHASVTDMLAWGRYLISHVEPYIDEAQPATSGQRYGAGLWVDQLDGQDVVWHTGSWQGFNSYFAVVPGEGLTMVVLCNYVDADPTRMGRTALEAWRDPATER